MVSILSRCYSQNRKLVRLTNVELPNRMCSAVDNFEPDFKPMKTEMNLRMSAENKVQDLVQTIQVIWILRE